MSQPKRNFLTIIDVLVSAGAAVIIFAAWAKLTHKSYADTMLTVGMWTETAIFLVYAVIEWVNPKSHDEGHTVAEIVEDKKLSPVKSMEKMMMEADITPVNLKRLGDSFQKLGTTVSQIGEVGDVVKSTSDFSAKTKEATTAMGAMKDAYANSATAMTSFNGAAEGAKGFKDQLSNLTKNMSSLNSVYELELTESNNHLKTMSAFYSKMGEASKVMMSTVDDATKTKENMTLLANNLNRLNQVYGNMLSAMQGGRA